MALVLKDRVKEITTTTGTGTITLAGVSLGYQAFSVIGDGNTTYYCIAGRETSEFEVGIGTYTLSGTTLSRTTILSSSNAGSAVNFSAGTKDVFVVYPAGKSVNLDASGNATFPAGTVALPSITTLSDTNTGVYFPAADTVGITAGGTQIGAFSSTGLAVTGALSASAITGTTLNLSAGLLAAGNGTFGTTGVNSFVSIKSTVASGGAGASEVLFGNTTTATAGYLSYSHATNSLLIGANAGTYATVSSTGLAVTGKITSTGNVTVTDVSATGGAATAYLGTVSSALYLNTPTGNFGYLASGNNGVVTWSTGAVSIAGTLSTTGAVTFPAGTVALPSITTSGDTNTGVYFPAADTVGITTGGTERMRIIASPNTTFTGAASFFGGTGASPYNGVVIGDGTGYNFVFGYVSNLTGLFVPLVTMTDNSGLAVTGTLSTTGVATFAAGTVALPSITTSGDTNTGVYFPAADTVGITAGGTERMRINSSGDAIFGANSWLTLADTGTGNGNIKITATGSIDFGGSFLFRNLAGSSEYMRIDSSGNVGIGTTANASAILDAQSTTKGVRMPNMTTTQKNAIATPAAGLMVYDTTLAKLCVYTTAWETITSL